MPACCLCTATSALPNDPNKVLEYPYEKKQDACRKDLPALILAQTPVDLVIPFQSFCKSDLYVAQPSCHGIA